MNASTADVVFMHRALELAERGWGRVHPNPLVGAVVVRDGAVVGEGFHGEYGGPHAEVVALAAAGERAHGATLYVTLEPCAHHGKTPPCTDAVRTAGVARLVYAAEDPSPVAGGGADRLRAAEIEVVGGVAREEARSQNAIFFHALERERTYVALKYGLSLDARLAETAGRPTDVTGPAARAEVHRLRAGFDAILIGLRTALVDDPLLTVRGPIVPRQEPVRIVVDTDARLPVDSRLARSARATPVWIICAEDAPSHRRRALERAGLRTIEVARTEQGVALGAALDRLWSEGVRSVLCEGGGRLGSSLLEAGRVDRLYLFYAPLLFGQDAVPAFPYPSRERRGERWRIRRTVAVGDDVLLVLDREE